MGYDNENVMDPVILDLETVAIADAHLYLEPSKAPENYKDPFKIEEFIKAAQAKKLRDAGLDPDLARIAVLGTMTASGHPSVIACKNDREEIDALRKFWALVTTPGGYTRAIVSFYGLKFDLPLVMRRSQLLGVPFEPLSLDKYRTPHIDLYQKLTFNGAIDGHTLKFYAQRFGIPVADDVNGKDIQTLVNNDQWEDAVRHCASDLMLTRALAQRLGYLPTLASQAVA